MAGMSDAALGLDDRYGTHASQSCSIAQYTAEKFYEYVAMIEMVYVLSTNEEARKQLLHEFSGSAFMLLNQSEMQDYFAEGNEDDARFYGRVGSIAEFFGYDETAAESYELAKTYQERAAYQRDLADRLYAQAKQQFFDFFKDLWSTLKQRYNECGWFYAASTVAISGAFVLGGIVVGAGAAAAAIRALKFIPTRLQNGKIRVEVRNERLGTSYKREWSEEDLAAKYGKPDENHGGTLLKETNRSIPDEPAEGMAKRKKDADENENASVPPPQKTIPHKYGKNENNITYDTATGRPTRAQGVIREDFGGMPRGDNATDIGRMGNPGDDGGHLAGHRFFGDTPDQGIVPQASNLNRGAWKTMENEWADWIKKGYNVEYDIKVIPPGAVRPDKFDVVYKVVDPNTGEVKDIRKARMKNRPGEKFERVKYRDME